MPVQIIMSKATQFPSVMTLRLTQAMADDLEDVASTARLSKSDFLRRLIECAVRAAHNFDWSTLDENGRERK